MLADLAVNNEMIMIEDPTFLMIECSIGGADVNELEGLNLSHGHLSIYASLLTSNVF